MVYVCYEEYLRLLVGNSVPHIYYDCLFLFKEEESVYLFLHSVESGG